MKEITRRLYTKPVMLTMLFLVAMALLVGLSVTQNSWATQSGFPVPAGNDEFVTDADGETYHDFGGEPIPANFFGSGSLAYSGLVALEGVPLDPDVSPVDTIIERENEVSAPGGSTPITMTGLSLESTNPITVTYSGGATEDWNVHVGLSLFKSSTGTMTINSSTFDSTLKVWPRFTFTRVGGGVPPKVLDTGGSGLTASQTTAATAVESDEGDTVVIGDPQPLPAPCKTAVARTEGFSTATTSAAATSSCPPVTLSSVNSPWNPCPPHGFCIPVPITEEERWARHRPKPKPSPTPIVIKEGIR